jgi:hypothetical protein
MKQSDFENFKNKSLHPVNTSRDFAGIWRTLLNLYSKILMTVPDDKLVALSGVAEKMRDIASDEHVAGLRCKTLSRNWRGMPRISRGIISCSIAPRAGHELL